MYYKFKELLNLLNEVKDCEPNYELEEKILQSIYPYFEKIMTPEHYQAELETSLGRDETLRHILTIKLFDYLSKEDNNDVVYLTTTKDDMVTFDAEDNMQLCDFCYNLTGFLNTAEAFRLLEKIGY
jgi:hypothetical protein